MEKPAVEVIVHYNLDGDIVPLRVKYKGKTLYVDKPSKPVKGASLTIGVQGYKYTCLIEGKRACLYQDYTNKWYIEM